MKKLLFGHLPLSFLGKLSFLIFIIIMLCSILAYLFILDKTQHANGQQPIIANLAPFNSVVWLEDKSNEKINLSSFLTGRKEFPNHVPILNVESLKYNSDTLIYKHYLGDNRTLLFPCFILQIQTNHLKTKEFLTKYGKPYKIKNDQIHYLHQDGTIHIDKIQHVRTRFIENCIITKTYFLGTDTFGRDVLSRIILGSRISIGIGVISVFFSILLGTTIGLLSGYFGGWIDSTLQWLMSVIWSLPSLLIAISISFVLGKGFMTLSLAIGLSIWVELARVVRGKVLSIKKLEFVAASQTLGASTFRILFHHILPNLWGQIVIISCANFATAILLEAGLSFLGLGISSPVPSWGKMIHDGYVYIFLEQGKWLAIFPGLATVMLITSINVLSLELKEIIQN